MSELTAGTTLQNDKYTIIRTLGQGGFGITYLAEHSLLRKKVAIKEFFFKDYCNRDEATNTITLGTQSAAGLVDRFRKKFIFEARTISQFRHPNIVAIHDIFTENGTAYYVMDYIEGPSLSQIIKSRGPLDEPTALRYFCKIAEGLRCIHGAHVNHLDIKPANIMLRESDGEIVIIDFGTSKQYDADTDLAPTTTTPVGVSAGYAPIEQYSHGGVAAFTPESDIYALGATLYKLLTGKTPPESLVLDEEGLKLLTTLSPRSQHIISRCMQVSKTRRPHSIADVESLLTEPLTTDNGSTRDDDETRVIGVTVIDSTSTSGIKAGIADTGSQTTGQSGNDAAGKDPAGKSTASQGNDAPRDSFVKRHWKLLVILILAITFCAGYVVYDQQNRDYGYYDDEDYDELEEESDFDDEEYDDEYSDEDYEDYAAYVDSVA